MKRLSSEEIERYSRHIVLPEIGMEGQHRIRNASVLLVGIGGLGSAQAIYLAAAGIGRIGLIDDDRVNLSNLQRQVIYKYGDVGNKKVKSAEQHLKKLNPLIEIEPYEARLESSNAMDICARYDIIIDGSDNFASRYLINDVCILLHKPNVYGSVYRFDGQLSVFGLSGGPCYRCLYPYPPVPGQIESCAVGGVFGALPGIIGSMQALEAVKLVCGQGTSLSGRLVLINALQWKFEEIKIDHDHSCPVCGNNPVIKAPIDYEEFCGINTDLQIIEDANRFSISPEALNQALLYGKDLKLIDIREPAETQICHIAGSTNFPYSRIDQMYSYIRPEDQIVIFCRAGIRSARVINQMVDKGYKNMHHLAGGILAWIDSIDPAQPKY